VRTRKVSPALEPLLRDVDDALTAAASSLVPLEALFKFLSSPAGRTDANCCATDAFFSSLDDDPRLQRLPAIEQTIVASIGGALHDAIYAPHIAANFESLPEQILARIGAALHGHPDER
jgi:hypothetical protein